MRHMVRCCRDYDLIVIVIMIIVIVVVVVVVVAVVAINNHSHFIVMRIANSRPQVTRQPEIYSNCMIN